MDNKASKVQRAGETATPATTALTPAQQRTSELEADRDGTAPTMAAGAFDDTDQKAAGIRQSVTDKAIASVKANIDADGAATVKEKKDAKKFAAQHAQAGVSDTLKVYSEELVNNQVVDDKKTELEAKAKEGYNSVAPKASVPLEVQKAKASAEAHKKVNAFAKLLITASVSASKTAIENKAKTGTDFLNVNVGDAGKAEVGNRHTMDAGLVVEADMESVYKETLVSPMKKAVLLKLGVGRSGIRRSAELNAFRQKLKDNAREQARADIDGDINTNSLTASKGEMTKQYYAMVAKMKAHSLSKVSVDGVMADEADKIVEAVVPQVTTKEELKNAGKTSAYDIARTNVQAADKIKAAGISGAKLKASSLLKEKEKTAVNEARKLTKGDKATGAAPDATRTDEIDNGVRSKVTTDEVAKKSIKESVEADSLSTGFTKLGKLIDISTPNAGDSSSVDVELKIPVASAAGGGQGYFLFGFGGETEREDKELSVNTQLTFGAGFQTFGNNKTRYGSERWRCRVLRRAFV